MLGPYADVILLFASMLHKVVLRVAPRSGESLLRFI